MKVSNRPETVECSREITSVEGRKTAPERTYRRWRRNRFVSRLFVKICKIDPNRGLVRIYLMNVIYEKNDFLNFTFTPKLFVVFYKNIFPVYSITDRVCVQYI